MDLYLFPEAATNKNGYGIGVEFAYNKLKPKQEDLIIWYTDLEAGEINHLRTCDKIIKKNSFYSLRSVKNILQGKDRTEMGNHDLDFLRGMTFENIHCEMLRPSFLKTSSLKVSVKELMEANSATALALEGVGEGIPELNFKSNGGGAKTIGGIEITGVPEIKMPEFNTGSLDSQEKLLVRILVTVLIFAFGYAILSYGVSRNLTDATNNLIAEKKNVQTESIEVATDIGMLQTAADTYTERVNKLLGNDTNEEDDEIVKNAIPIFLQQVMYSIPEDVMLVSIQNVSGKTMSIVAKATDYEQLGLFKVILYTDGILTNVTSTTSYKENDEIYVTILGDLPE